MKIAAHFLPEDFPVFLESVKTAEEAGYARAWVVDSQMLWEDVWVYMTHALGATERIQVGVAVSNPLTRHYTVTASAAATLAQLHPGRVVLGLGRGDSAVRTLGLAPMKLAEFRDTLRVVRRLCPGEAAEVNGTAIRLPWATRAVPVLLAAYGNSPSGESRNHVEGDFVSSLLVLLCQKR